MLPFEQGGLDPLCGVYSILNAEKIINNTTSEGSQKLFNDIVRQLDKRGILVDVLTGGMRFKTITMLLSEVMSERIPYQKSPFQGRANPCLSTFWHEMGSFLSARTSRVVLLGLAGEYDHWTVAQSISDKQVKLFDSVGLHVLNRRHCTTGLAKGERRHMLFPAQTYFLGKE